MRYSLLPLLLAGFVVVGALLLHPLLVYSAIHQLCCAPGKRTTKSSPASLVLDQHYPTLPPLPFVSTVSEIISSMPGRPCRALRPPRRIMYLQNWSLASHANFCSNDGRAEENASNAECMNDTRSFRIGSPFIFYKWECQNNSSAFWSPKPNNSQARVRRIFFSFITSED